jgi:capsular polysaccharide biosynthesis protein
MNEPLQSTVQNNITVSPLTYDRAAEVRYVFGAWRDDGAVAEELLLQRGRKKPSQPPRQTASTRVAEDRVYGGIIMRHYGHFLFESLSRVWFLKRNPGLRAVWHALPETAQVTRWQQEILAMLGIAVERRDFILDPTTFAKLAVPQPGAELWTSLHPEQVEAIGVFPFRKPTAGRKLWLSRARMTRKAGVQDELRLEELLGRTGWTSMQPDKLPVREQLERMADAEVIAGFDGSAFHTLMLGRDVRAKLIIVPRGGSDKISATYDVIAKAKGLSQSILPARIVPVKGDGRGAFNRLEQPRELAEALNSL